MVKQYVYRYINGRPIHRPLELGTRVIDDLTGDIVTVIGFNESTNLDGFTVCVDHGYLDGYRFAHEISGIVPTFEYKIRKLPPIKFKT